MSDKLIMRQINRELHELSYKNGKIWDNWLASGWPWYDCSYLKVKITLKTGIFIFFIKISTKTPKYLTYRYTVAYSRMYCLNAKFFLWTVFLEILVNCSFLFKNNNEMFSLSFIMLYNFSLLLYWFTCTNLTVLWDRLRNLGCDDFKPRISHTVHMYDNVLNNIE